MNQDQIKQLAGETKRRNIPFYLNETAVSALIKRIAGERYVRAFEIRQIDSDDGFDGYALYCKGGKIRIDATSGSAAAVAFDRYLKKYCRYNIGFITTTGSLPQEPPVFRGRQSNSSRFHYRYLYNYCTFAYSYAFHGWEEWENVLDRAILAGYNLVLNPVGQESVWKRLLERFGYSPENIENFLVNPAFLPFVWMMNMSGYGGKYPAWWFTERAELAKKMNARLHSLGVGVMLPGYCGMVPDDFKDHFPQTKPVDQGFWNGYRRPSYLMPGDNMFDEFSDAFYQIQRETIGGDNAHYYSVDPFHEGGISDGIDLGEYASKVMAKMKQHDEKAVWFFQGWQTNPKREMIDVLDKSQILVGNLLADSNGDSGDNFGDSPWLYCNVNNFGAQHVLRGNIKRTLAMPFTYSSRPECTMVGVGYMPEGVANDEVFFDIFAAISVQNTALNFNAYIREFLERRYGRCNAALAQAWNLLANRVYLADSSVFPMETVFCARPSLTVDRTSTWGMGCSRLAFQETCLPQVVKILFEQYEELKTSDAYRFDLVDLLRQCNAMAGWKYAFAFLDHYKAGEKEAFTQNVSVFLRLFELQNDLVSSDKHFLVSSWLNRAKALGKNDFEKRWFEFYARVQITVWSDSRSDCLHDYAAKEWQGMLSDFYRPRWERFISMLEISLATGESLPQYNNYDQDVSFCYGRKSYPCEPTADVKSAVSACLNYYNEIIEK